MSNWRYLLSISLETTLSMMSTGTSWKQSYAGQKMLWASPSWIFRFKNLPEFCQSVFVNKKFKGYWVLYTMFTGIHNDYFLNREYEPSLFAQKSYKFDEQQNYKKITVMIQMWASSAIFSAVCDFHRCHLSDSSAMFN